MPQPWESAVEVPWRLSQVRLPQVIVDDLAKSESEVSSDVNRGNHLENRQFGHRRQGVGRQGKRRRSNPCALQDYVLQVVLDQLTNPRATVHMRNYF